LGSFTLKVAGDAGIYSVQEVDLTEVILRGWPQEPTGPDRLDRSDRLGKSGPKCISRLL